VLPGSDGSPRHDSRGEVIVTRLDGERLQRFATTSGGAVLAIGNEPAVTPLLRHWGAATRPDPARLAGLLTVAALVLLLIRQLPDWPRRRLALVSLLLLGACQASAQPPGEVAFAEGIRQHQAQAFDAAANTFAEAARLLDGEARASALYNQGTILLRQGRPEEALPLLESALLLLPGDSDVRNNFILALRAVGSGRGGGFGEGERNAPGTGSGELSREQALQLLEGVRAAAYAPVSDKVQLRETSVVRDW
ncbi:MAG: tetratricopeptide repeat protein, partial [Gemmatimonadales bacterium]